MPTPSVLEVVWGNIDAITWPAAILIIAHRLAAAWESTRSHALSSDELAVADIPEDLIAIALNERESWAQEEVMRVIRESYDRFGNWNAVRSSMGVAERENTA